MQKQVHSASNKVSSAANAMSGAFKKIAAVAVAAFSVKAIISFGQQAISLASDITEVQNVVDTAFGGMSAQVDEWAKTTVDKFGVSELAAKRTASTYMAMSKGMGQYGQAAADMAIKAAERTGDIASFYNMTQEQADTMMKSIWTGETESLKRIGVVMTQTNLDAYALANGFGKVTSKMSQAEQVQLRYQYVMEQTRLAAGDFEKTSDSWANQTRVLTERWKEFMSVIGTGLIQVLTPVVKFLNECLSKLISIAQQVSQVMSSVFGWDIGGQEASATATNDMADAQTNLADATKAAAKEAKKAQSSFDELNVLSELDGSIEASSLANAVTGAVGTAPTDSPQKDAPALQLPTLTVFDKFVDQVQKGISSIDFGAIKKNCERAFAAIQPIAKASFDATKKVASSFMGAVGSVVGGVTSLAGKAVQTVSVGIATWLEKDNKRIAAGIAQMGEKTASGFDNISGAVDNVFSTLGDAIDRNRPQTEQAIAGMLSGFTTFGLSVGTIFTDSFDIATGVVYDWTEKNKETLGGFFDNLNGHFNGLCTLAGTVFGNIGDTLSDFWDSRGANIFENFMTALTDIGGKFLEIYNEWIAPVIDKLISGLSNLWTTHLKPLWDKLLDFIGSIVDCISTLWNNVLSPIVSWLVDVLKPAVMFVVNTVWSVIETVIGAISDALGGIMKALGGLLDFITGVFSGDWEKAWCGICDFFGGIWDAIWGIIKGVINLIIDGINMLWGAVYAVVSGIVNAIGGIAGAIGSIFGQDWNFSMPSDPPLIPKLATGGIAYQETLAIIGEGRYDEAVLPLSNTTYQRIADGINDSAEDNGEQIALLREQNALLRKLVDKDPTVRAVITTSDMVSAQQRKNRRDGKTVFPVGV